MPAPSLPRELSPRARAAVADALLGLAPTDRDHPAPLCERIAKILDALGPLTRRPDLSEADREILRWWLLSDTSLLVGEAISRMLDAVASLRPPP